MSETTKQPRRVRRGKGRSTSKADSKKTVSQQRRVGVADATSFPGFLPSTIQKQ